MKYACYGCQMRKVGCHSRCELYAEYLKYRRRILDARVEEIQIRQVLYRSHDSSMADRMRQSMEKHKHPIPDSEVMT